MTSMEVLGRVPGESLLSWLERSKISIEEALATAIELGYATGKIENAVKAVRAAYEDYVFQMEE